MSTEAPMNVYKIVNEKVTALLEQGVVPWRRPWAEEGAPRNIITKKVYRGINYFLLGASKYASPYWMTYRQATGLGGHVNKGEHGTLIVFWKVEPRKAGEIDDTEEVHGKYRYVLRYYLVFNLAQCELPEKVLAKLPKAETH